jgi:tetratricopeptide (TPR) repeat protein
VRVRGLLTLLAAFVVVPPAASALVVRAHLDPPALRVGETADLAVEVEGAQSTPAPDLGDTAGLGVRYVGPATQVSIVNGRMSTSVTHHFSVRGATVGVFTIGPIVVTHQGARHAGGTIRVQVLPAGTQGGPAANQLRLELRAGRSEVFLGERVPLTVRLAVGSVRVTDLQYPTVSGDGFALEKFPEPQQRREGSLQVVEFATSLTPLRAGKVAVGPAVMHLSVLARGRSADPFFGGLFGDTRRPTEIASEPLALAVLPLPEADRPPDFSGAVGRFDVDVAVAPLTVTAGDPVTVTTTVRGEGNLDAAAAPAIAATDVLHVYPPQTAAAGAAAGEKRFEQVLVPQRAGALALPSLRFSYFDPEARRYHVVERPLGTLTVHAAPARETAPRIVGAPARDTTAALGRDLVFVKEQPGTLRPLGARRHRSLRFWTWQAVPLAAWLAALAWDRRRRRLSGDARYARFTRAGREARRRLGAAREALRAGDLVRFYDTLAAAVSDYLSAKLDLPPGAVTADTAGDRLRRRGLPPALAQDLQDVFAACERARFAPGEDGRADGEATLARADALVRALERERRLAPPIAALWLLPLALAAAPGTASDAEGPAAAFFRGNALYAGERYAEAAAEYERVRAGGRESGHLYFNLGNAYVKAGQLGRAILNYERARRLLPRDPDVEANLGYARELSGEPRGEPSLLRLLFPFAVHFTSDELLLGASVAWTLVALLLVLGRLVPRTRVGARRAAVGAAAVLVLLGASAAFRLVTVDLPPYAIVVTADEATVRFEPSADGTRHFGAKPGALLRLLAARQGWAQVARGDGRRGWVEREALAEL